jgi:hypothetical protein
VATDLFATDQELLDLEGASELHARLSSWLARRGGPTLARPPARVHVVTASADRQVATVGELREMICELTGEPFAHHPADADRIDKIDFSGTLEIYGLKGDYHDHTWSISIDVPFCYRWIRKGVLVDYQIGIDGDIIVYAKACRVAAEPRLITDLWVAQLEQYPTTWVFCNRMIPTEAGRDGNS